MRPVPEPDAACPPRAVGEARASVQYDAGNSRLRDLRQSGSLKLMFPRPTGTRLQIVSLNTAGGVTGGDRFALELEAGSQATSGITTQAAERIYRAAPGAPGEVSTRITIGAGASLHWLPQETILFNGAALRRSLDIQLAPDAQLLACETLVFGRREMGETIDQLWLRDSVNLWRADKLCFADRLRLDGNASRQLARKGVADGATAMASVLFASPLAAQQVEPLRAMLPETGGVSALDGTLLFLRVLAPDSFELRQSLIPILRRLSDAELPRTWMI